MYFKDIFICFVFVFVFLGFFFAFILRKVLVAVCCNIGFSALYTMLIHFIFQKSHNEVNQREQRKCIISVTALIYLWLIMLWEYLFGFCFPERKNNNYYISRILHKREDHCGMSQMGNCVLVSCNSCLLCVLDTDFPLMSSEWPLETLKDSISYALSAFYRLSCC